MFAFVYIHRGWIYGLPAIILAIWSYVRYFDGCLFGQFGDAWRTFAIWYQSINVELHSNNKTLINTTNVTEYRRKLLNSFMTVAFTQHQWIHVNFPIETKSNQFRTNDRKTFGNYSSKHVLSPPVRFFSSSFNYLYKYKQLWQRIDRENKQTNKKIAENCR